MVLKIQLQENPHNMIKFKEFLSDPFVEGDEIILNYHRGESVHLYKMVKKEELLMG